MPSSAISDKALCVEQEQHQEALLLSKYGGLKPKQQLLNKRNSRKCFDSADYALAAQAQREGRPLEAPLGVLGLEQPIESLQPKLQPSPVPARRLSNLGDS
ncbi:hypothetical protein WJX72_005992 [[Myrmecia] bisecta]|uniref:cAMP-regulated phosphoprotein 19 n=1 Tax=[Myrmecia] bisecta TaxID=41462 RepID=A0AAW1P234_9CHLO